MLDAIGGWILRLTGTALVSAAALAIAPEGGAKRAVRLACGLAAVAALISVGAELDVDAYLKSAGEYRSAAEKVASEAERAASDERRTIIEERTAAYILDKADALGIPVSGASVKAEPGENDCWLPSSAEIRTKSAEASFPELSRYIETELGIPEERQEWSTDEG